MEEISKEIEQKQSYLVNEIMNQNYNPEKFSEYISNLKENGTDLNNWTFEELKNVVISFKNQEKLGELNDDEDNIEKEVENVKNSFIIQPLNQDKKKLNNNPQTNINNNNPYDNIFNDNEKEFQKVQNIMSDLNKNEENKNNCISSEMGDFEILDESEFIDSSKDKLVCIKQIENNLLKYNDLYVNITG